LKTEKELTNYLMEALQTDNPAALRAIGREAKLETETLIYHTLEAAGLLFAIGKEPKRSPLFEALLTVGKELDSAGIAWGIIERKRREERAESKQKLFGN
jgi:hypothetical protein